MIDTIRTANGKTYATVCDPWDTNVHVTEIDPKKSFHYDASQGGPMVDFWGTNKGKANPYTADSKGRGIALVYRTS